MKLATALITGAALCACTAGTALATPRSDRATFTPAGFFHDLRNGSVWHTGGNHSIPDHPKGPPPWASGGRNFGAPGPIVATGLPALAVAGGYLWFVRRRRRRNGRSRASE